MLSPLLFNVILKSQTQQVVEEKKFEYADWKGRSKMIYLQVTMILYTENAKESTKHV